MEFHLASRPTPPMIFGLIAAALLILTAIFFGPVLLLVFTAILLAVFLDGITTVLVNHLPLRHGFTFTVVVALFLAGLFAAGLHFGPLFVSGISQLADTIGRYTDEIIEILREREWGQALLRTGGSGTSMISSVFNTLAGFLTVGAWAASAGLIVLFTGIYLAAEPPVYTNAFKRLFPDRYLDTLNTTMARLGYILHWWLVGRILSMAVVGILTWIGLLLLGIPLALTLALLATLLSFIPNIGPVLSAVPAVLVGLDDSPTMALYVVGLYVAVQTVESYFITPLIQRRTVLLPPALVITAQLLMTFAYGTLGLLVATPLTVVAVVLVKELYLPRRNQGTA